MPNYFVLLWAFLLIGNPIAADSESPIHRYKTGPITIMKMGFDLYQGLPERFQNKISVEPLGVDFTDNTSLANTPYLRSKEEVDLDNLSQPKVLISPGFVDLVNHIAHARALDAEERNYFRNYVEKVAQTERGSRLPELPGLANDEYWSDEIMNEQLSNFYQMTGAAVSIELSHHYLGHFKKYHGQIVDADENPIPINRFLSKAEWEEALLRGVRNALEAGYGVEGLIALYESIDRMPKRPEWTEYFLPKKIRFRTLRRTVQRIQKDFFDGKEI